MSRPSRKIPSAQKRIVQLQKEIASFDVVCSGNLRRRVLVCGKENCCCKGSPPMLHGPYHYWSRRHGGRLVQRVLAPDQAEVVGRAIHNYKSIRRILLKWEKETVRIIEVRMSQKADPRRR